MGSCECSQGCNALAGAKGPSGGRQCLSSQGCALTCRSTGPPWAGLRPRHVGRLAIFVRHLSEATSVSTLVIGIITGALGVAYIVYGRRQTKFVPLIAGVFLCAYPYFIDSLVWLCVVGALLLAAPFVIDF